MNGIVSLMSLSGFSLSVYRDANYFCILFIYPETLLYSLISPNNFLVESLRFSVYSTMSSANRGVSDLKKKQVNTVIIQQINCYARC